MKLSEKQELVRLLTLYQADLLKANEKISKKPQNIRVSVGRAIIHLA